MRLTALLILSVLWNSAICFSQLLRKTNEKCYTLAITTSVEHWGMGSSTTDLFIAFLGSNEYQQCQQVQLDSIGIIIQLGETGDQCIYYHLPLGRQEKLKKTARLFHQFELQTADITVDFDHLAPLVPYDPCDSNYIRYTGSNMPFINVEQPELAMVSATIWQNSTGLIDYVRKCYLWVAEHFTYSDPVTGFKSLDYIVNHKAGDCGNMCSVFITLLRMQHIPARHLMGFRPDGSLHVWADFYLQDQGWIPVDVTYKNADPEGDYFGNIQFEQSGFIVQRGIGQEIQLPHLTKRVSSLQTYAYEVSYTKENRAKVYIERKVSCQEKGTFISGQ